jgi:hypothetical protein
MRTAARTTARTTAEDLSVPNLAGKLVVLTGASDGIGLRHTSR